MIDSIHSEDLKIYWKKHVLNFKFDAGTSRGILKSKDAYYIIIESDGIIRGIGECCVLKGLSIDDKPGFQEKLQEVCDSLKNNIPDSLKSIYRFDSEIGLNEWPSIRMGLETAIFDLLNGGKRAIFRNAFFSGSEIPINGLVWMGDRDFMLKQVHQKIESGFSVIKMKIGAIDFEEELSILKLIREKYDKYSITIRVDANGAFGVPEANEKLKRLAEFDIHSIEQPIATGNWSAMQSLCKSTPLPIALDEELIGIYRNIDKEKLLDSIKPQFIILKPSLLGGFRETDNWIAMAKERNIGWWITSALESNIGLNAIAQYTFSKNIKIEQGLGTGQLFNNNIQSPLEIHLGKLMYNSNKEWDLSELGV